MAMQIDPTFAHIPPGPEGIMAQDEVRAIDTDFSIGLDAFLAIVAIDRSIVIFPCDRRCVAVRNCRKRSSRNSPLSSKYLGSSIHSSKLRVSPILSTAEY
jgi:hypothetical protein